MLLASRSFRAIPIPADSNRKTAEFPPSGKFVQGKVSVGVTFVQVLEPAPRMARTAHPGPGRIHDGRQFGCSGGSILLSGLFVPLSKCICCWT